MLKEIEQIVSHLRIAGKIKTDQTETDTLAAIYAVLMAGNLRGDSTRRFQCIAETLDRCNFIRQYLSANKMLNDESTPHSIELIRRTPIIQMLQHHFKIQYTQANLTCQTCFDIFKQETRIRK